MKCYRLDGHTPVPCEMMEWAQSFELNRVVAKTRVQLDNSLSSDLCEVSTIFLGLDHNFFNDGPPLLFETMIFGGEHDGYQARCSTWEQAEAQHAVAVAKAKS